MTSFHGKRTAFPSEKSQKKTNPQQAELTGDSLTFLYQASVVSKKSEVESTTSLSLFTY
jgi:hypothetical protein